MKADFNCIDEKGRIWGLPQDKISVGETVILDDGEIAVKARIELDELGNKVAVALDPRLIPSDEALWDGCYDYGS